MMMKDTVTEQQRQRKEQDTLQTTEAYTANYQRIRRVYFNLSYYEEQVAQLQIQTFSHKSKEEDESSRRQELMTNDDSTASRSRSNIFREKKEEKI